MTLYARRTHRKTRAAPSAPPNDGAARGQTIGTVRAKGDRDRTTNGMAIHRLNRKEPPVSARPIDRMTELPHTSQTDITCTPLTCIDPTPEQTR
jgi:hypothetical protein